RVRSDAHGLVDHDDVVVLMDEAHALGDLGAHLDGRLLIRQLHVQDSARFQAGGAGRDLPVHEHVPGHAEVRRAGAGKAQHAREAHIHALPSQAVGDEQGAEGAHARCPGSSSPSGASVEASAGASVEASEASAAASACFDVSSAGTEAGSAGTPNRPSATMSSAPPTTPMSATLNTGQCGSSRKSTTAPWNGEGSRRRRSWMFPSAPPVIRPRARVYRSERTEVNAKRSTPSTIAICRQVTTGVISEPIPQAAPVLYSSVSCRNSPRKGCGSSRGRFDSAQSFVIWSATARTAAISAMPTSTVPRPGRRRAPDPWGPTLADSVVELFTDRSSPACPASRSCRAR